MNEKLNKTTICSIVFLDIIDYSKKSVSEQIDIKNQFNQLINHSLKGVDHDDRIILDTGDGAAIAHLGSPEDALFVSLSIRDEILKSNILSPMPLYVRFGINLGPVRLVSDINGQPNIIGDGINVAQRIMSFAKPNQIVVSRSYYDVTSRLTQEISQMFDYSGIKHDKHVREHEIYAVRLMKDQPATEAKSFSTFNLTKYLEPLQGFIKRLNWKYAALSLPAIVTCVLVIKSAASPNEPTITMQEAVAATQVAENSATRVAQVSASNKGALTLPAGDSIQLAHYVVEPVNASEMKKPESDVELALIDKTAKKTVVEQPVKTQPEDRKSAKKVAKKSDKKLNVKKETSELPADFVVPANHNTQPVKTVAKVAEPQIAATEQSVEKSGWKTFTDSVKQGKQRECSQVEITMNQCH